MAGARDTIDWPSHCKQHAILRHTQRRCAAFTWWVSGWWIIYGPPAHTHIKLFTYALSIYTLHTRYIFRDPFGCGLLYFCARATHSNYFWTCGSILLYEKWLSDRADWNLSQCAGFWSSTPCSLGSALWCKERDEPFVDGWIGLPNPFNLGFSQWEDF